MTSRLYELYIHVDLQFISTSIRIYSIMSFDLPRSSYGYENLANNRELPPTYRASNWRSNSDSRRSTPLSLAPAPIALTYPLRPLSLASLPLAHLSSFTVLRSLKTSTARLPPTFTPSLLTYMAATESGRLIFRRIAPAQVNAWLRYYPEVVENPDIRIWFPHAAVYDQVLALYRSPSSSRQM